MLFANSTSLLWLSYYGLSLLVIVAVYFALTFFASFATLSADLGSRWGDMGARQFSIAVNRRG